MRWLSYLIALLACATVARADLSVRFENPPYTGSAAGVVLPPQDLWYQPVPGSADFSVFSYAGNSLLLPANPAGQAQFSGGRSLGGSQQARAQKDHDFSTSPHWTITWNFCARFDGVLPATQNLGSLSLQPLATRDFNALYTWADPNTAAAYNSGFLVYDAAGVQSTAPGLFPGPQWQNLAPNQWYRQSITIDYVTNQVVEVTIQNLTTGGPTASVRPSGWFLGGGAAPSLPLPTSIRTFAGGTSPGNIVGFDNIDICPFVVGGFAPGGGPEGTLISISGCGFGTRADDLCVGLRISPSEVIPLSVVSVTDTQIQARLGPVPPGASPGPIVVAKGSGVRGSISPSQPDLIPENPQGVWTLDRAGDPRQDQSINVFVPVSNPPPPGVQWFFGDNQGGALVLTVAGDVMPNTQVRLLLQASGPMPGVGACLDAIHLRLRVGGDAQYLADRVCDAIQSALSARGINSQCLVSIAGPNARTITFHLLDSMSVVIPIQSGALDVCTQMPIKVNLFPNLPVTAFFNANLTNQVTNILVSNVGPAGDDGATISPLAPTLAGVSATNSDIPLSAGAIVTITSWGLQGVTGERRVGVARITSAPTPVLLGSFAGIGSNFVLVQVYHNTLMVGQVTLPAGTLGQLIAGPGGTPAVTGFGARPTIGPTPTMVWLDLSVPATFQPVAGPPLFGNQLRLFALAPMGPTPALQAVDIAAAVPGPGDATSFVLFGAVEGGICYANCDGSSTAPILNINDFSCFLNAFAAGDPSANCDGSTTPPTLNINDFSCFLNAFAAGCP